jgi:signal transduction histidine kinase/DNA-binding response OmpR family regulator
MTTPQKEKILVMINDQQINYLLERVLRSIGYEVQACITREIARRELNSVNAASLVILGEQISDGVGIQFAGELLTDFPGIPIVFFVFRDSSELLKKALQIGVSDYLCLPLKSDDILRSIDNSLRKARLRRDWVIKEAKRATASLQRKIDELETLARLGRTVTGTLDLDHVLSAIVEAAVELIGAEEGSLLLLDQASGELYMRASRNFQEEFVRTFRLPIQDTLAGSVLRSGKPVIIDEKTPQKIKTAYLVHNLAYVALQENGRPIGVLGVDNRVQIRPIKDHDIKLLNALAEYAVIAIQNASLYKNISDEHKKLDTILNQIEDGVIVIDLDRRLMLVNQAAQDAFNLTGRSVLGMLFTDVFGQPELLELVGEHSSSNRAEFSSVDGRVFSAMLDEIPNLGVAITFHDVSHLKKLDRIKTDFVNTVSHDLRSPLTAILGYVELIERVGVITPQQKEYIQRVQGSVQNITSLVNDLLNLGRIEAGFDTRKENVAIDQLIRYTLDGSRKRMTDKDLKLVQDLPSKPLSILANPIQMRQMLENLLDNAIKYTPDAGTITVRIIEAQNQAILQVSDTGIGIPPVDLPYIFDKFYRASNVSGEVPGTGLGLSIVRSVVENHGGRIWVDSSPGMGTTFTAVFPLA